MSHYVRTRGPVKGLSPLWMTLFLLLALLTVLAFPAAISHLQPVTAWYGGHAARAMFGHHVLTAWYGSHVSQAWASGHTKTAFYSGHARTAFFSGHARPAWAGHW